MDTETVATPRDTVVAELALSFGEPDDRPDEVLGNVMGVALGPRDEVYVSDWAGSRVRAFDRNGALLGTVGSEGRGPGEFFWPNALEFDAQGQLYVRDLYRLTIFGYRDGVAFADSLIRMVDLGGGATPWPALGRVYGDKYYYPNYIFRNGEVQRYFFAVYDSLGVTGDTIDVPMMESTQFLTPASYLVSDDTGALVEVNRAPFEPRASWDLSSRGTLLTTTGEDFGFVEWSQSGDTARVASFPGARRAVPDAAARDSAAAFLERLDSIPVPLDRVRGMSDRARRRDLPDVLPESVSLHADAEGNVWLRRWPPPGNPSTVFDVLDPSGQPIVSVVVPADLSMEPPPVVSAGSVLGVVRDPLTDVQRVVLFSFDWDEQ